MINFEILDVLINLKENENILKILDIFYWKVYEKWIKYYLFIKTEYISNNLEIIINDKHDNI